MKLVYRATTRDGKIIKGLIEAKGISEAAAYLRTKNLLPIRIAPKDDEGVLKFIHFLNKSSDADLVFFTRQIASMLTAGLTLVQSLVILKDQVQNPSMAEMVNSILSDIEEGKPFSLAIAKYPKTFSSIYISLIQAAESSGLLDRVLFRLAENLEKQQKLKETIKGALLYPAIVITGMVIVMFIMMIFVIPQLSVLYENLNIPLPLPTRIIMGLSSFTTAFWPLIFGFVILGIFFYKRWYATDSGRLIMDDLVLKIPVFGVIIRESILTEFTRTLGLLIGSGTLIVESLRETSSSAGNVLYKNAIEGVSRRVEKGMGVGDAMSMSSLFSPIVVQMVKIGEQTGKLDESLTKLSEYFEREVDQSVKTLTTAMEPFIMVVLGVGVAFLIISIITPIYNLTSAIQ